MRLLAPPLALHIDRAAFVEARRDLRSVLYRLQHVPAVAVVELERDLLVVLRGPRRQQPGIAVVRVDAAQRDERAGRVVNKVVRAGRKRPPGNAEIEWYVNSGCCHGVVACKSYCNADCRCDDDVSKSGSHVCEPPCRIHTLAIREKFVVKLSSR